MSKLEAWASMRLKDKGLETAWQSSEGRVKEMSIDELKQLWDSDWPLNDVINGIYLEHIHSELNVRGESYYCAV